jgi:hypothetical protein
VSHYANHLPAPSEIEKRTPYCVGRAAGGHPPAAQLLKKKKRKKDKKKERKTRLNLNETKKMN